MAAQVRMLSSAANSLAGVSYALSRSIPQARGSPDVSRSSSFIGGSTTSTRASDLLSPADELSIRPIEEVEAQAWIEELPPRSMLEFWSYNQQMLDQSLGSDSSETSSDSESESSDQDAESPDEQAPASIDCLA